MKDIAFIQGKINLKKNDLNMVLENIKKLENGSTNEYYNDRYLRDLDFYNTEKNKLISEINNLYIEICSNKNEENLRAKVDEYIRKDINIILDKTEKQQRLEKIKIDFDKMSKLMHGIILSPDCKIIYDNDCGYFIIKDLNMMIDTNKYDNSEDIEKDYRAGKLLLTLDDIISICNKYDNNLKINRSGNNDLFQKFGRLFIKRCAILILNVNDMTVKYQLNDKYCQSNKDIKYINK